eukprot:294640-Prorocentrum_minimum.AAC.1
MQTGNGATNAAAAKMAVAVNVPKFVYISVASIAPSAVDGTPPQYAMQRYNATEILYPPELQVMTEFGHACR